MNKTESAHSSTKIGIQLKTNKLYRLGEILFVFVAAFTLIRLMNPFVADKPVIKQAVIWVANILMLFIIWLGLKLRGESWKDFGLSFNPVTWKGGIKLFLLSLLVFVLAAAGFIVGSIVMANITGIPEGTNMSGYDYLKNNILMLVVTLAGVYIVSSFGEEVIYRAFLINRLSQLGHNSASSKVMAVILSSVIFGLVHFEWGPMGIVQTGCMGLALGTCYIKLKKRLWILILAHAYMDTILMLQLYLSPV